MPLRQRPPRASSSSSERQELLRQREAARARIAQGKAAARNRRVRGTSRSKDKPLLDPHGLYGTRTAQRMRASKRREISQKILLAVFVVTLVSMAWTRFHQPRIATLNLQKTAFAGGEIASFATLSDNELWFVESSGALRVLNLRNGAIRRFASLDFTSRAAPLVTASQVFIADEAGTVHALARANSRKLWTRKIGASLSADLQLRVLDVGGARQNVVLTASDEGVVVALKAENGQMLWRRDLSATIGNGFSVVGNRLWIPVAAARNSRGGLICLDLTTRKPIANSDLGAAHFAALSTGDAPQNKNKIVSAGDDGALFCFDSATQKRLWKTFAQPLPNQEKDTAIVLRGAPLFKTYSWGERVFIGGNDGVLRAFDATNGRELWRCESAAPISNRPISWRLKTEGGERDFVICASNDGTLRVLDAQSGEEKWRIKNDSSSRGIFIADDMLWNVAQNGEVRSFQP